jgi:DNA polymerase III tau subunit V interacting with alpha
MPHALDAGTEPLGDAIPLRLESLNARNWATLLAELPLAGMARSLAMHALPRRVLDGCVELDLDPRHAALIAPAATERLSAALGAHFGCDIILLLRSVEPGAETPAGRELRLSEERREAAVAHIEADANVKLLLESFAGRLQRESIRAVDAPAPPSPAGG